MNWSQRLRDSIQERQQKYIAHYRIPKGATYASKGKPPTKLYTPYSNEERHGNFLASSYQRILENEKWQVRLKKSHPTKKAFSELDREQARELDSSNNSDALLMNVFCHPSMSKRGGARVARLFGPRLFGLSALPAPQFGHIAKIKRRVESKRHTEIDLWLESKNMSKDKQRVIIEAKLTEGDFTSKRADVVESYCDLDKAFHVDLLPRKGKNSDYSSYQLIRNILAAHQEKARFYLLCDARRPDLLHAFMEIVSAVKDGGLRGRCGFRTWQEIAAVADDELKTFLKIKYGISA